MIRKKSIAFSLLLMLCNIRLVAQQKPASNYALILEKVYLHTDRAVYGQGDTLWYKAYLVNAQNNKPISSSGNLYVELINPVSAKIIDRETIRLDKGTGNGDFALGDTLQPGLYKLRAYTNWMRNYGDHFIFEKDIVITGDEPAVGSVNKKDSKPATAVMSPVKSTLNTGSPIVSFYPESGSFITGFSTMVAVKATDRNGRGKQVSGAIVNGAGDIITRFNCDTLGMGLFTLLPEKGQNYHAEVNGKTMAMPAALSSGASIQIKQTDTILRIVISVSHNLLANGVKPVYTLKAKHGGNIILSQPIILSTEQSLIKISTSNFPAGICAMTLYDEGNKPHCERLLYIDQATQRAKTIISLAKQAYHPQETISINLKSLPQTNLSVPVVDAGLVDDQANDDILAYLLLKSEIKGSIEQPRRYFDTTNINRLKQLDLLMMTQGWRDFVWRRLADTAIHISYAAEHGISITGNVYDEVTDKRMPGLNLSLYAPGASGDKLYPGKADTIGQFAFNNLMLYGKQNITLTAINAKGHQNGTFAIDTISTLPVRSILDNNTVDYVDSIKPYDKAQKAGYVRSRKLKRNTNLKEVRIRAKSGINLRSGGAMMTWGTDQVFDIGPKDKAFKTLEWYLLQNSKGAVKPLVDPGITHGDMRTITGVAYWGIDTFMVKIPGPVDGPITSFNAKTKPIAPIIFINGKELYMDNYEQAESYRATYFGLAINKIKKIILKHVAGTLHGYDIPPQAERIMVDRYLLYLTLADNALTDNSGILNKDIIGYYEARKFYQPPPNVKSSLDDMRPTLYWAPNIITNQNGEASLSYYNTAEKTKVRIIVQGISSTGIPVSQTAIYQVE